MMRRLINGSLVAVILAMLLGTPFMVGRASQFSCVMPTTGTVTGLTLVNDINQCNGSLLSIYSGASAPSGPTTGMLWWNTTTSFVQQYDGASWINLWEVDTTNHLSIRPVGDGTGQISVASTTDLGTIANPYVQLNGSGTITSFGTTAPAGRIYFVVFTAAVTITNSGSMLMPGGNNLIAASGDVGAFISLGSGNWRTLGFTPITIPTKTTPTTSDFVFIQDAAGSNQTKRSLLSAIAALIGVTGIDTQTGAFTTGNGIDSASKVIELTSARRTLPTISQVTRSAHSGGFSANASGTYTSPANCQWVRVRGVGGGGGGGGGNVIGSATAGGTTSFSTLSGSGGGAGSGGGSTVGPSGGGSGSGGDLNIPGGTGSGTGGAVGAIGGQGGNSYFGGAGAGGAGGTGTGATAATNTGSGGGGGGGGASAAVAGGGGAGGYFEKILTCPVSGVSFAVGAGGAGMAGSSAGSGGAGADGQIIVDEHYGS